MAQKSVGGSWWKFTGKTASKSHPGQARKAERKRAARLAKRAAKI